MTALSSILRPLQRPASLPSLETFAAHLRLPALVRPAASNPHSWAAVEKWSHVDEKGRETLQGMRVDEMEESIIEVEVGQRGRGYLDQGSWEKVKMPFGTFLDAFIAGSIPSLTSSTTDLIGYVAQQDLLALSPTLAKQCPSLPHTTVGPRGDQEQWRTNTWVGPRGTFTPIHRDPYENIFVQVVGKKRFHVFPPAAQPYLYLEKGGRQQNTSTVPTENYLLRGVDEGQRQKDFPLLNEAAKQAEAANVTLEPGDALFLPRGWFHCVASLTTSASVNFWFR
ncbi:Clavaminate synthase-like protein [Jaminaea rosea]|uniref:Clavaminate synthase-like protein n=1 Tax=Jaminaea rosea TaxID=1569628 RepID=A0A316V1P0_9BASI|nr:Clavaminate synthase-like protein [Jaminaea rosea]PWN30093.1 Clavaminate synthase-like protein [Jaminaea rosea]